VAQRGIAQGHSGPCSTIEPKGYFSSARMKYLEGLDTGWVKNPEQSKSTGARLFNTAISTTCLATPKRNIHATAWLKAVALAMLACGLDATTLRKRRTWSKTHAS